MSPYEPGRKGNAFREGARRLPHEGNAGLGQRGSGCLAVTGLVNWETGMSHHKGLVCKANRRQWGARVPALKLHCVWEGLRRKSQGQNRVGEIPLLGIAGGLTETWAMEKANRARKAETPKQPSLCLRLRAPYFYPDQRLNLSKPWEGPWRICQGFKPDSGNPTVRHYRGASRNVRHGETVNPSCNRKSGHGNPSPTAGRARSLSQHKGVHEFAGPEAETIRQGEG